MKLKTQDTDSRDIKCTFCCYEQTISSYVSQDSYMKSFDFGLELFKLGFHWSFLDLHWWVLLSFPNSEWFCPSFSILLFWNYTVVELSGSMALYSFCTLMNQSWHLALTFSLNKNFIHASMLNISLYMSNGQLELNKSKIQLLNHSLGPWSFLISETVEQHTFILLFYKTWRSLLIVFLIYAPNTSSASKFYHLYNQNTSKYNSKPNHFSPMLPHCSNDQLCLVTATLSYLV